MDIGQALKDLDATGTALPEQNRAELDEKGYTVLPGVMDGPWLGALRERFEGLCEAEGIAAGIEVHQEEGTRRLADLVNKGPVFDLVYTHPTVLAAIHHVIGREFKMSSLNARDALPGEGHQGLHTDWSKDYDGRFHVCNSIWLLDDFTEENGCTRLVPGTHRGKHPGNVLKDPEAPHPEEEHLVAPAGTVAVFNSHTGMAAPGTGPRPASGARCIATSLRGSIHSSSASASISATIRGSASPGPRATSSTWT